MSKTLDLLHLAEKRRVHAAAFTRNEASLTKPHVEASGQAQEHA